MGRALLDGMFLDQSFAVRIQQGLKLIDLFLNFAATIGISDTHAEGVRVNDFGLGVDVQFFGNRFLGRFEGLMRRE